jgi:hypothetical protein
MKHSLAVNLMGIWAILLILGCARQHDAAGLDCRIDKGPCVKRIMPGNITAVFDIRPKPVKMMSDLFFDLSLAQGDRPMADAEVILSLTMPGMYMGEHAVSMHHKGGGHYGGSSVIPRCPSGRRIWKASFIINKADNGSSGTMTTEYTFEIKEK